MLRSLPWIILGGIALIVGVIMTQLLGTYFYLRSPERVVNGAFSQLLDAKSFTFDLTAAQATKDGFSLNVSGSLDKQILSKPTADLSFSFQAAGQSFYGNGQIKARDGQIYLRFDQVAGIPGLLPGALQSVWADLDTNALITVGKENVFPQAAGNLTEDDLQALKAIIKKYLPVKATDSGNTTVVDSVPVVHYHVTLDRVALTDLVGEAQVAVKGVSLEPEEQKAIIRSVAAMPPVTGEIWVVKSDGRLMAATLVYGSGDAAVHANIKLTRYDAPVIVEAPLDARPLIELIRRIIGNTLSGVTLKLPFDIPLPILQIEEKIPVVNLPVGGAGDGKGNLGGVPDLLKLFYGTDKPFGQNIK